jgi:hypothetical protein
MTRLIKWHVFFSPPLPSALFFDFCQGQDLANEINSIKCVEVSAKTKEGLEEVFEQPVAIAIAARNSLPKKKPVHTHRKKCILL